MATRQAYQITGWRDRSRAADRSGLGRGAQRPLAQVHRLGVDSICQPPPSGYTEAHHPVPTRTLSPQEVTGGARGGEREEGGGEEEEEDEKQEGCIKDWVC